MSEWKFKRDTSFRKQFFVPDSFAHPAKMDAQLLIKIVEKYTQVGETILDPMAGSGTTMLACTLGRHCLLVELEEKFCKMMRDNWEEVRMRPQLGSEMGDCQIIQGDARQLEGLVDKIVTSPPYASPWGVSDENRPKATLEREARHRERHPDKFRPPLVSYSDSMENIGNLPYGEIDKCIFSPPYTNRMDGGAELQKGFKPYSGEATGWFTTRPQDNIGNLPYGQIDKIVTSPPYEAGTSGPSRSPFWERLANDPTSARYGRKAHPSVGQGYDTVDSIITSPPYEQQIHPTHETVEKVRATNDPKHLGEHSQAMLVDGYGGAAGNIGNLKSDTYLQAMLQVYQQCYKVLKPQGLMILVTKNFIRNKQIVRLDTDTIKLCEQAGFRFVERHYRKLPSQSFWRVIYHQKHPEVEQINYEDILVFVK